MGSADKPEAVISSAQSSRSPYNVVKLSEKPSFDMLVLGCGGGPAEDNLSAYLVKPANQPWSDGFTSVDGGSCLGALTRLLDKTPALFADFGLPESNKGSPLANAGFVFGFLRSFIITHAHWDHISGLVLASGSGASQKSVYGSKQTLGNLSAAMNGGLWPVLGSYEAANGVPYVWKATEGEAKVKPSKGLTASARPISHGTHHNKSQYASSAFFFENEATQNSFLIFGDLEADSISGEQYNRRVWQETALRIAERRLSTIFIECSYTSSRPKAQLYGHLSPPYIFEELRVLASFLPPRPGQSQDDLTDRLQGITVAIIHIKDLTSMEELEQAISTSRSSLRRSQDIAPESIRDVIRDELLELAQEHKLGVEFVIVEQGMRIEL